MVDDAPASDGALRAALRESEERFRSLAATAPVGVYVLDADGHATYVNERLAEMLGRPAGELLGRGWQRAVAAEDADRIRGTRAEAADTGTASARDLRMVRPDGRERWVRTRLSAMTGEHDEPVGFVGFLDDVTDEVRDRQELATREAELRMLAENTSDFLSRHAPDGTFRYASPASRRLLGCGPEDLEGGPGLRMVLDEDRALVEAATREALRAGTSTVTYRVRREDGTVLWFESNLRAITDAAGRLLETVAVSRDVTERKTAELELAHQALHDALTGLPNRTLFLDRLGHALRRARRGGTGTSAVFFLDVDRFKLINDSLGHKAGDAVLVDVAGRLRRILRPSDTVARFGGDEFTVLCEDVAGELEAVAIAQRIVDLFDDPFRLEGGDYFLSTSVGIALSGRRTGRPEDLIRDADAAMYRAKERGKARYELFDAAMRAQAVERLELENALRRAVRTHVDDEGRFSEGPGELRLHFQPAVEVRGAAPRASRIAGFEALVRWQHPERGLLRPADFVPLAEETGLIVPLGSWVLRRACVEAARWRDGRRDVSVSVNLAARQLAQPDVVELVERTLRETGLAPEALCLEITESAMLESGATTATLRSLKDLGVRLAIDDFGTGWSSLGHLRAFPIDVLKLDRSFVSGLGRRPQDASIVAAVISLARALGLTTVAEGIETADQLAVLGELGCDLGQGFLFAPAEPAERAAARLVDLDGAPV